MCLYFGGLGCLVGLSLVVGIVVVEVLYDLGYI